MAYGARAHGEAAFGVNMEGATRLRGRHLQVRGTYRVSVHDRTLDTIVIQDRIQKAIHR